MQARFSTWKDRKTPWLRPNLYDSISFALIGVWIMSQAGFFDVEERLARLCGLGEQLETFSRTADFEAFGPDLEKALAEAKAVVRRLIRC